jgi:hypothetical protein
MFDWYFFLCSCCIQGWSRICRSDHWRFDSHHVTSAGCVCGDPCSEQTSEAAGFSYHPQKSIWCYYKHEGTVGTLPINYKNHVSFYSST